MTKNQVTQRDRSVVAGMMMHIVGESKGESIKPSRLEEVANALLMDADGDDVSALASVVEVFAGDSE